MHCGDRADNATNCDRFAWATVHGDLRKIVYLASRSKEPIEAAIEKAGHLCALLEDLPN